MNDHLKPKKYTKGRTMNTEKHENRDGRQVTIKRKIVLGSPFIILILLIVLIISLKGTSIFQKGEESTVSSAMLTQVIDVSELSSAQFTYNGIAQVYEKGSDVIKCNVKYKAKVKAGIDMNDISFEIDDEKKTVTPILPEIKISSCTVDEEELSFIPENTTADLKDVLKACEEDAETEASGSPQLMGSAHENLEAIVEALIYPVLNANGYTVVWK